MPRFVALLLLLTALPVVSAEEPKFSAELVFPLHGEHNHAPGVVECPNGDLLVSWYRGSGERRSDDVAVYGARKRAGEAAWSEPFLLADHPEFPDCNTCLMIDEHERLWLFWPIILDNRWESCLTNFKVAAKFTGDGPIAWDREGVIFLKPDDFGDAMVEHATELVSSLPPPAIERGERLLEELKTRAHDKLYQRLGWQPRCKPTVLPGGRILLPLYSDTFSLSLMAISDDGGQSWFAGRPTLGFGAIQPSVLCRDDGTLVAFMRENGYTGRVRVAESTDDGVSWGPVGQADLPNPGSGLDGVRLASGRWLLVYNDATDGRNSLAVSLSEDEGRTWPITRHLEQQESGSYHYPAVVQGAGGEIHVVYSYFVAEGKSMKHAAFNEAWIVAGDE